jgi:sugar/nucleoside kinase (ribokinase family)
MFQLGVIGPDSWGNLFLKSLERSGVHTSLSHMVAHGATGQCMVMTDATTGERTMRTAMSSECILKPDMVQEDAFQGSKWSVLHTLRI